MLWTLAQWVILVVGSLVFLFVLEVTMVMEFVVWFVEKHPWWGLVAGFVLGLMSAATGVLWLGAGMASPRFDWHTPLTWPWLVTAGLLVAAGMLRIKYEQAHDVNDPDRLAHGRLAGRDNRG